ncbi:outer membrane porin OpcP [Caballeronia hypogeia]|uniref:Outer membrane porin OpcP n=1 Tax=Caballeronia hypogeia TaxID=1777140 RepID=A0A157ZK87_9BURK|nr:porin [Caballeronia hypogeia]SAK45905.1 outer membrane porin OpcP [Caballeronia hypogeia]
MNKKLVLGAACMTLSGLTHAQSSVTLYGVIDEGLTFNTNMNGSHSYAMQSGVLSGSRWGLKGVEDLGGGLKAIFTLENGFDPSNGKLGQGGLEFGRQAFVGLSSQWGTVTLGRQYDLNVDFVGPLEAASQWAGNIGAHPADLDNLNNAYRTNNAIKFKSISYGGFSFGGMYSLGGVAGDATRNQIWSLGAGYARGPLTVGVGYINARNPNVSFFGNSTSGTPSAAVANSVYPVFSGYLSAHTYQTISAGAAYNIGALTIGGIYSNIAFKGLGDTTSGPNPSGYSGNATFNSAELNLKYQLTPALLIGAAYSYTDGGSVSTATGRNEGATYHQGEIGVDYFLSKRTDVYAIGVYQKASGTDSRNREAVASINNQSSPSSNDHQALIRVGLRHKF